MSTITINGNVLNLNSRSLITTPNAYVASLPASNSIGKRFIIIKSKKALSNIEKQDLIDSNVAFTAYVDRNTYLCLYESGDLESLRRRSYLEYVDVYQDFFKIHADLKAQIPEAAKTTPTGDDSAAGAPTAGVPAGSAIFRIMIGLHVNSDSEVELNKILLTKVVKEEETVLHDHWIETEISSKDIHILTTIEGVQSIEEQHDEEAESNIARSILNHPVKIAPLNPAAALNLPRNWEGAGQVIHIADTGFDKGLLNDLHPAFGPINGNPRLLTLLNPANYVPARIVLDDDSHGTHVAGCALGNGISNTMGGATATEPGPIKGTAPAANFLATRVLLADKQTYWTGAVANLLDVPYNTWNARVSNHSYGPPVKDGAVQQPAYDVRSTRFDEYLFTKNDLLVCWSAGNSGRVVNPPQQVNGRSCCKNVLTVGNSLNGRKIVGASYNAAAQTDGDINTIWRGSSRGPTREGRRKPDVCAPGTAILSTLSRGCVPAPASNGISTDPGYLFLTGTSMATPLVSGCAAVLREVLVNRGVAAPSAALLKVLLIHGAVDMFRDVPTIVQPKPENLQGFGRVNMGASIHAVEQDAEQDLTKKEGGFVDAPDATKQAPALAQGNINYVQVQVDAKPHPRTLKATLTWMDHGGVWLATELGLAITVDNGERRHGNMNSANMTAAPWDYDFENNVQQIVWENVPAGQANISVQCTRVLTLGEQAKYALAWSLE